MRPKDMPGPERFEHGTRARYVTGCRCEPCSEANRSYARMRQKYNRGGDWNGLVPADKARAHMLKLSKKGIGRRTVQDISGVGDTTLQRIRNGTKKQIRKKTEEAILAVTADVPNEVTIMDSTGALRKLELLKNEGYTEAFLAEKLGYKTPRLQFKRGRPMIARNIHRIYKLYEELTT
jgi:hypothetical protein